MNHPAPARPSHPLLVAWDTLKRSLTRFVLAFIEGERSMGQVRLITALVFTVLFVIVSRLFENVRPLVWFEDFAAQVQLAGPTLRLAELVASFFTPQVLRHAIPPLLGFALALLAGASYIRDLLELPNLVQANKFLIAVLFGGDYPRMAVWEGKAIVADPATNPMLKIGGPGWVDIQLGNAALFERVVGPSAVYGVGTHFLRRFETLREALDLREIERVKNDLSVMTKDGIPLVLSEMRVRFRIRSREQRTPANPFPVITHAIRQAVYHPGRRVTDKGLENWADMIAGAVSGTITGWLSKRLMDELIPPPDDPEHPDQSPAEPYRQALHGLFRIKETRQRFADMGAEVIWVSVGHLRPDPNVDPDLRAEDDPTGRDKIYAQLLKTWGSKHEVLAHDEIASARAYAKWMEDTSRAQVLAELVSNVTNGLNEMREVGLPMAEVVTARVTEYLTTYSEKGKAVELKSLASTLALYTDDKLLEPPGKKEGEKDEFPPPES
jgi:hypothetical protein